MRSLSVNRLLFYIIFSIFALKTKAQSTLSDSIFYKKAVDNSIAQYHKAIGYQSRLYNGPQYSSYPFVFKEGHPFFNSDMMSNGSIVYENVLYPNIPMLFDEVTDVIVLKDEAHLIQLVIQKVDRFTLSDNNFIRIVKDSTNNSLISKEGFYNILYEGRLSVLKQEVKSVKVDISSAAEGIVRTIEVKQYYFIKKNNEFYLINSKKDVLELFNDHKKAINDYIKSNKLNFRNDKETLLTKICAYYEQL